MQTLQIPPGALMVFFCAFGAFCLYMMNKLNGKRVYSLFKVLNIDVSSINVRWHVILFDMIISSALSGFIVYFLIDPTTPRQAIAAGLAITGILAIHVKGNGSDG